MEPKKQRASAGKTTAAPKIVVKGTAEFRHDLFKADVQHFKKNVAFKKGELNLVNVEHSHIYHSHNSGGRPQQYSSSVGGHFHEVKTTVDADGNVTAECGPPLRTVVKKKKSGSKRVAVPISWYDDESEREIVDNHRHDFQYLHSEYLSQAKVREIQAQTQAAVQQSIASHADEPVHQRTEIGDTTFETDDD